MRRFALFPLPRPVLIGFVLAVALGGAFLAYGLRQALSLRQTIPFHTLEWGLMGPVQAATIVINDETTWSDVWEQAFCRPNPDLACDPPPVNFTSTTVLAVFSGQKPTTGYETNVTSVSHFGSSILVDVRVTIPGSGCYVGEALTYPFHIVTIPKVDAKVEFAPKTFVYDC